MDDSTNHAARVRFVAFLGITDYKPCDYFFPDDPSLKISTPFASAALLRLLKTKKGYEPREISIVCTDEAARKHSENLTKELATAVTKPKFLKIPSGDSPRDLWEIFETLRHQFLITREEDGLDRIVLDITHGFRAQPFFAAAVLAFARLTCDRRYPIEVYYGGSPKNPRDAQREPVEIWDLTRFIEVLDWAQALNVFMRTGRCDDLYSILRPYQESFPNEGSAGGSAGSFRRLLDAIVYWSSAYEGLRIGDLLLRAGGNSGAAERLDESIKNHGSAVAERLPPIRGVLDDIRDKLAKPLICDNDLTSLQGKQALAALAQLYLRIGRYIEAATVVREAVITQYARRYGEGAWRPGKGFSQDLRDLAERSCLCDLDKEFNSNVGQVRNDLDHAGFNKDPRAATSRAKDFPSDKMRTDVRKAVEWFEQRFVKGVLSRTEGRGVFLNLSNHPLSEWGEPQKQQALGFGCEDLVDMPFPAVPPDATTEQVRELAAETVRRIPQSVTHAMVMGEFTLTFELVRRLQKRGVRCLVATTTRDVEQRGDEKVVRFHFEGFREYPELEF